MATTAHRDKQDEKFVRQLLRRYLEERGWRYRWAPHRTAEKGIDTVLLDEKETPIAAISMIFNVQSDGVGESIRKKLSQITMSVEKIPYLLAFSTPEYPPFEWLVSHVISELMKYNMVSAFSFLHEVDAQQVIWNKQEDKDSEQHRELLRSVYRMREYRVHISGSDLPEMRVVRMKILLNPSASNPWTDALWGVYDEVWTWDTQQGQLQNLYDGGWELLRTYRLHLLAGVISVPFREDVRTSRSEDFYEERE